jgi:leader peptidase (prepilin peptidase)/N-methyltransferase
VTAVLVTVVFLLGLAVGSFLNVVIHRVPREESLLRPGSHCPHCQHPVRGRHNIPLLGWALLRGRCADCGEPIGLRYPAVELITAVLFLAMALRLDQVDRLSALPAYLWFVAIGVALSAIDLSERRLPNAIVLPSYPVLAVLLAGSAAWEGDWWALARAGIGAAGLFGFFFLLAFIYPAGMGYGDVKLAGIIGGVLAYLSWPVLAIGAFAGFLLGAVVGVVLIATGRGGRKTQIPFGPFMVAGALLGIFVADPLTHSFMDSYLM